MVPCKERAASQSQGLLPAGQSPPSLPTSQPQAPSSSSRGYQPQPVPRWDAWQRCPHLPVLQEDHPHLEHPVEKQEGWSGGGDGQQAHTGASQVENSPHHQSLLLVQAHPGSQKRPARHREANEKSDSSGAKPCMLAELWASSASKPRLEQGCPSHRERKMFRHFFTHLLSRVAGNPLSARLSVIPRLPLHKNTRHHQDCIQQWISAPTAQRISGAPVYPKPLSGLWCFLMPADPSLLHPQ